MSKEQLSELTGLAHSMYSDLKKEEQEKAISILESINGMETRGVEKILDFCKEAIKTKTVIKI